ncbi:MAG: hypothetical protein NC225_04410 [Clostridium sp.]|nr:hypothetical protein [Clostridium sp.]MCM1398708.1 hypothetical protein [Clostridium sp.]MCM1458661.1 hypothetical protein [Bacteroides sp.]
MVIHTNRGEVMLKDLISDIDFLPHMCFECEVLSGELKSKLKQHDKSEDRFHYIILFVHRGSEEIQAIYREGDSDENAEFPYDVSLELTLSETKSQLKPLIYETVEQCYFSA